MIWTRDRVEEALIWKHPRAREERTDWKMQLVRSFPPRVDATWFAAWDRLELTPTLYARASCQIRPSRQSEGTISTLADYDNVLEQRPRRLRSTERSCGAAPQERLLAVE